MKPTTPVLRNRIIFRASDAVAAAIDAEAARRGLDASKLLREFVVDGLRLEAGQRDSVPAVPTL